MWVRGVGLAIVLALATTAGPSWAAEGLASADGVLLNPDDDAQTLIIAVEPAVADAAPRELDHGQVITRQAIAPAAIVRLSGGPDGGRPKLGEPGQLLFPVRDAHGGAWWCGRDLAAFDPHVRLKVNPFQNGMAAVRCFQDTDGDGRFDVIRKADGEQDSTLLVTRIGKATALRAPAAYQRIAVAWPIVETAVVRYLGPVSGRIGPDGDVKDGEVRFSVDVGAVADLLFPTRTISVLLDANGRGALRDGSGLVIEVDRVGADGRASIRLVSGLKTRD